MNKHVVLVEDELNIAEAIRFVLSNDGWRVETLANGLNAVEVIRKANPDLVLLDVMLPGRSGFEILHELRADPALADLLTDLLDGFGPVGCHCPVALQARDAMREIAQQFTPMHRVHDFRMELRAVEFAFGV